MFTLRSYLLNTRPYSFVDILLLGLLAKASTARALSFAPDDLYPAAGLLALWCFYNLILEFKHSYAYRGKTSVLPSLLFLALAVGVGLLRNPVALVFVGASTLLVLVYLQKNRNRLLGNFNNVVRGLIQSSYFLYAQTFSTDRVSAQAAVIALLVFLLTTARGLVGDIRDVRHNSEAQKKTFPVTFGVARTRHFVVALLLVAAAIEVIFFRAFFIALPPVLFAVAAWYHRNGYALHQLSIVTTSFFSACLVAHLTGQSVSFINLIYVGIFLNMVTYPLLERKSNPLFVLQ
jgi:hypothetical protein